jgi:parallel beta-helix repeat protein
VSDITITNSSSWSMTISDCNNSTVGGNTITRGKYGIRISRSGNNVVSSNTITRCSEYGIYLSNSSNIVVSGNSIANNSVGIWLISDTSGCMLWGNVLTANAQSNAKDNNGGNQWDNGSHGNWWDDYFGPDIDHNGIGDIPYSIPGEAGAQDRYPLVNLADISPPTIVSPSDVTFKEGTSGRIITWHVSDANPYWYNITRNGTLIVESVWNGSSISINIGNLTAGTYLYKLVAYDRLGSSAVDEVHVTVTSVSVEDQSSEDKESPTEVPSFGVFTAMLSMLVGILATRRFKPRKKSLGIG